MVIEDDHTDDDLSTFTKKYLGDKESQGYLPIINETGSKQKRNFKNQ